MSDTAIGNILVLLSVFVLTWEVYILRRSIQMQTWQDAVSKINELDKIALEKPEISRFFYPDETDANREISMYIGSYLLAFEMVYIQRNTLNPKLFAPWEIFMRNIISLPAFSEYWQKLQEKKQSMIKTSLIM